MPENTRRETFFHGTMEDFDAFDLDRCGARADGASNGALGIWMANEYWLGERFAGDEGIVMEVHCNPVKGYQMSVSELMRRTTEAGDQDDPNAYFHDLRAKMLSNGYGAVEIVEDDGSSAMSILLDLTAITHIEKHRVSPAPIPGL